MELNVEELLGEFNLVSSKQKSQEKDDGLEFGCLTDDEFRDAAKLQVPAIANWSWFPSAKVGQSVYIRFGVINYTGLHYHSVNLTLFFGAAHFVQDTGLAISGRDEHWPYTSRRAELPQGQTFTEFRFDYVIPQVPFGTYYGNSVLWKRSDQWNRNCFYQTVS